MVNWKAELTSVYQVHGSQFEFFRATRHTKLAHWKDQPSRGNSQEIWIFKQPIIPHLDRQTAAKAAKWAHMGQELPQKGRGLATNSISGLFFSHFFSKNYSTTPNRPHLQSSRPRCTPPSDKHVISSSSTNNSVFLVFVTSDFTFNFNFNFKLDAKVE